MPEENRRGKISTITPVEHMSMEDSKQNKALNNGLSCKIRPERQNMVDSIPCCRRYHNRFCFKLVVYLIVVLLDVADLFSDWLLFRDVAMAKHGLVYGPPGDELKYSLLAFSVVGTLTFIFEGTNLWWDIFRRNPWCDVDLLQAIVIWIEDVPQIVINIFIVACREEAISYFQLVKASVIILGAVIRIIVSLCHSCNKSALRDLECAKENKDSCRHVVYRSFIMIGLIITFAGAITIFLFTQSERNPDGSINFKIPHSVVEGKYDDEKYFANVSVYFSHKILDFPGQQAELDNSNILRLLKIDHVKSAPEDLYINVTINNKANSADYMIDGAGPAAECFTYDKSTNKISIPVKGSCQPASVIITPTDVFYFTFHFIKPSAPGLIFGDISYNMKYKSAASTTCQDPDFSIENDVSDHTYNADKAALHYYRAAVNDVTDNFHIQYTSPTEGKFYHPKDLIDIIDVWKTGFAYCKSTGSLSPNRDADLLVKC